MINKKIVLVIVLFLNNFYFYSQEIKYEYVYDNPDSCFRSIIGLEFLSMDYNFFYCLPFTVGVRYYGDFFKKLNVNVSAKRSIFLFENLLHSIMEENIKLKNYNLLEANSTLYLFNKKNYKNVKITLDYRQTDKYIIDTHTKIPGYTIKMFGIKGGINVFNNNNSHFYPNNILWLSLGLQLNTINNIAIKTEEYGVSSNSRYRIQNIDFILGLNQDYYSGIGIKYTHYYISLKQKFYIKYDIGLHPTNYIMYNEFLISNTILDRIFMNITLGKYIKVL